MRTCAVLFGILIAIALIECGARMLYVAPWHEQLISEQETSLDYEYPLSRLRFRDDDYPRVKPADTYRLLILGDSFTFGLGVANRSDVFPDILEERLKAVDFGPGRRHVEVLNAGFPGSVTENWLDIIRGVWTDFDPDAVLIVYFLRDGITTASIPGFFDKIRTDITKANRESLLYRASYTARIIKDQADRRRINDGYIRDFNEAYLGDERQTARWRQSQETLMKIVNHAWERSADVAFVIFPILVQLDEHYPFRDICENIEDFTRRNDVPTFSLLPTFAGRHGPELWVSPYDQHPNEAAHAIVADALLPYIEGRIRGHRRAD